MRRVASISLLLLAQIAWLQGACLEKASAYAGSGAGFSSLSAGGSGHKADANCGQDASDPYDPRARMLFGRYKGMCIDTAEERVPVILKEDSNEIAFANFRHARRWWIATFPKSGVENAYFQLAKFNGLQGKFNAGHGEIRLVMRQGQPVRLREQRNGHPSDSLEIYDFLISAESFQPVEIDAGLAGNVGGDVGILSRFVSVAERVTDELVKTGGRSVIQTHLLLSPAYASWLAQSALHRSVRVGYSEVYDYLEHHCVTVALETLDEAFPPQRAAPGVGVTLGDFLRRDTIIGPALRALYWRGLIHWGDSFTLESVSDGGRAYLPSMIAHMDEFPAEQAQLRAFLRQESAGAKR
jgi:hypothetical protein